jgi:hypothetical protein
MNAVDSVSETKDVEPAIYVEIRGRNGHKCLECYLIRQVPHFQLCKVEHRITDSKILYITMTYNAAKNLILQKITSMGWDCVKITIECWLEWGSMYDRNNMYGKYDSSVISYSNIVVDTTDLSPNMEKNIKVVQRGIIGIFEIMEGINSVERSDRVEQSEEDNMTEDSFDVDVNDPGMD